MIFISETGQMFLISCTIKAGNSLVPVRELLPALGNIYDAPTSECDECITKDAVEVVCRGCYLESFGWFCITCIWDFFVILRGLLLYLAIILNLKL